MPNYNFEATWDTANDWSKFTVATGSGYMAASRSERHQNPYRAGAGRLVTSSRPGEQSPYVEAAPTIPAATGARHARWTVAIRMETFNLDESHIGPFQIRASNRAGADLGVVAYTSVEVGELGQSGDSIWVGSFWQTVLDVGPGVEVGSLSNAWQVWDWHCRSYGETANANTVEVTASVYVEAGGFLQRRGLFIFDAASLSNVYSWTGFRIGLDDMATSTESFTLWVDDFRVALSGDTLPRGAMPNGRTWLAQNIQ